MVFKIRYYYRYIAPLLSILILHGCSGYHRINDYDYETQSLEQKKIYVVYSRIKNIYQFVEVTHSQRGFIGILDIDLSLDAIPYNRNTMVIFTDSLVAKHKGQTFNEVLIPYEAISKVTRYEFDKATQITRYTVLATTCLLIVIIAVNISPNFDSGLGINLFPSY
jgi:hypothetical protein